MKNKIMLNHNSELPLKDDKANLFLKIMIAAAVFLFSIALSGQLLIRKTAEDWNRGIVGRLTVQIKPVGTVQNQDEEESRINKIIQFIEAFNEVESATLISDKKMHQLIKPWLGNSVELSTLPLPKLLDVKLKKDQMPDLEKLGSALQEVDPQASIDNHRLWLSRLLDFSHSLEVLALFVLVLVLLISAFSIFYATETSLEIHGKIIEILHIIGATDDYIAKQYAVRGFWNGFIAGIAGLSAAFIVMYSIARMAANIDSGILNFPSFDAENWLAICSLPLWSAVLSMATAYMTVKRTLGKMM